MKLDWCFFFVFLLWFLFFFIFKTVDAVRRPLGNHELKGNVPPRPRRARCCNGFGPETPWERACWRA